MHIILNNPYRLLGLLVGATAIQFNRHRTRIPNYISSGNEIPSEFTDFSFETLGELTRSEENIANAASKLNIESDKMSAALFWFYNGYAITDDAAFDALKEGNKDIAIEIWRKMAYDSDGDSYNEVTKRNASAFHNLSTLYLQEFGIDEDTLQLKFLFLESDYFNELKQKATDDTYKISKKDVQLLFLNGLTNQVGFESSEFINAVSNIDFSAKNDFLNAFMQKPIEQLVRLVNECKALRKSKKEQVIVAGTNLYNASKPILNQLKKLLYKSNLNYTSISDKISDEILQCGIQLFNDYKEHETYDPGEPAMNLFVQAKSLAMGSIAKQRCQENTKNLQDWIDDKPEREKQAKILIDFEKLTNLIKEFEGKSETVANGKQLLLITKLHLTNVKNVLGSSEELYIGLSTRIASNAQSMCVSEINKLQEQFTNTYDNASKLAKINLLKQRVNEAWDVTTTIGAMDLRQDFRTRYNQNRTSLSNLRTQLMTVSTSSGGSRGGTGSGSGGGSGCYIATMAYGDYDHPQVIILRQFRDEVLVKTTFGQWFIKTYYYYSPKLVEKLKNKNFINRIIRKLLNQFIKLIK
jgi:hypothetical protein